MANIVRVAIGEPELMLGHSLSNQPVLMGHVSGPVEGAKGLFLKTLIAGFLVPQSAQGSVA